MVNKRAKLQTAMISHNSGCKSRYQYSVGADTVGKGKVYAQ